MHKKLKMMVVDIAGMNVEYPLRLIYARQYLRTTFYLKGCRNNCLI